MRTPTRALRTAVVGCMFLASAMAQNQAPPKLAYLVPQLFGTDGLTLPNPDHLAHFDNDFQSNFVPFNTALGNQLTSLPIPSPASGFTYMFDTSLGVYTRSAQSFGPILAERAETIGKDKFTAGFSFQHFRFTSIDGADLNSLPSVFRHTQTTADPNIKKDIITTRTQIDSQIDQFTAFFTYGVGSKVDLSVAIPVVDAKLSAVSAANIRRVGTLNDTTIHFFLDANGNKTDHKTFSAAGTASGLGDVLVRTKATILETSAAWIGAGVDLRLPTGDAYNFLGSGTLGVKPFVIISGRTQKITPHVNIGYQWNGSSILAGDIVTGARGHLPNQFTWTAGFDAGISPKLSFAFDMLGQTILNAGAVQRFTFTAADGSQWDDTGFVRQNSHLVNGSAGFKINPVSTLLISFNVLFKVNDAGLRSQAVPLVGVAYSF
jgi:hypothetical protein